MPETQLPQTDSSVPPVEDIVTSTAQSEVPKNKKLQILLIIFVMGVVVAGSVAKKFLPIARVQQLSGENESTATQFISEVLSSPLPTPFPLEEMTVPYLRNRSYTSTLEEGDQVSANATYTSQIASYDSDGLKLRGLLTKPTGEQPADGWPAIIFIHGYIAPSVYKTTSNYMSYVDQFARNGFVVFKIDLRGHDQSEGEAGGAYYSADYIIDTLNARAALKSTDFVHPNKIGLWGHSMAGNVVLRSLVAQPEIPAVVIWAGAVYTYSDIQEYGIDDNSYRPPPQNTERARKRNQMRELYGEFDPTHWFWKLVTPANYLSDIKGAIEVHHAVDDPVVSVEYARGLMRLLDTTNVPHELHEYQSGGHNLTGSSFNQAMQESMTFFRERMGGE